MSSKRKFMAESNDAASSSTSRQTRNLGQRIIEYEDGCSTDEENDDDDFLMHEEDDILSSLGDHRGRSTSPRTPFVSPGGTSTKRGTKRAHSEIGNASSTFRATSGKRGLHRAQSMPSNGKSLRDKTGRFWTESPHITLVSHLDVLKTLQVETNAKFAKHLSLGSPPDGGKMMNDLAVEFNFLAGYNDADLSAPVPPAGTEVIVIRGLCPLREKTLNDGRATLSGAFVYSLEEAVRNEEPRIVFLKTNLSTSCHRKGVDGIDLSGGQAGCQDPKGHELEALSIAKQLYIIGLRMAGVIIKGIIASSNAAMLSIGIPLNASYFSKVNVGGVHADIPIFCAPHFKFVNALLANNLAVSIRIGGQRGDPLSTTSRIVDGWAKICSELLGLKGETAEIVHESIYTYIFNDASSRATIRDWENRFSLTSTPEVEQRLLEERVRNGEKGGDNDADLLTAQEKRMKAQTEEEVKEADEELEDAENYCAWRNAIRVKAGQSGGDNDADLLIALQLVDKAVTHDEIRDAKIALDKAREYCAMRKAIRVKTGIKTGTYGGDNDYRLVEAQQNLSDAVGPVAIAEATKDLEIAKVKQSISRGGKVKGGESGALNNPSLLKAKATHDAAVKDNNSHIESSGAVLDIEKKKTKRVNEARVKSGLNRGGAADSNSMFG
jgi:hypothetical protein